MEIVSYVLEGELAHKDSLGTGSIIRPGDVQRMSAGRGVQHSEFNPAPDRVAHFLQIWILPSVEGGPPSYEQKRFAPEQKRGRLCLVAAPDGAQGAVRIQQDARIYAGLFDGAEAVHLPWDAQRRLYVHVARGTVNVNGKLLDAGDAVRMTAATRLDISGGAAAEVLVFDLPGDGAAASGRPA
jgi:redox-sensitive bicupin YhaK (pirin superfamily)